MILWLTGYIVIPVLTLAFVQDSNWFTTNFSVIGSRIGREEEFVLWGLIVGIYFFWCLRSISRQMEVPPVGRWLAPAALILLVCAITTPYLPEKLPLKAFLHVIFAFTAAVCLMLCLILTVWRLYRDDSQKYRPYLLGLAGIILISFVLLWVAGIISSALEIFFTIASAILTQRLCRAVTKKRSPSFLGPSQG